MTTATSRTLTPAEALDMFDGMTLTFSSYYKFVFAFEGKTPDGGTLNVSVGGDADDIYRMEVVPGYGEPLRELIEAGGDVYITYRPSN